MFRSLQKRIVQLLRWSEKYTKTDMVYLAHGSFWLSGSSVITAGVSFGLALAFANLLSQEDYGIYKYILTLFGILCVACLRGMDTAVVQGAARGFDGTVISGLWAKMRWSLVGSLAALIGAAYYFYNGNSVLGTGLIFAAFFIPLMEPFGIFNSVLIGKKNFKLSSLLGVAGQATAAIPLFITLLITNNPVILFLVYVTSWSISRYVSLQIVLKQYPPNDKHEVGALSYALHSSMIGVSTTLIASLDSILVFHYLGAADLAVYAFALAPVSHAKQFLSPIATLATPKFAQQTNAAIKQWIFKRTLTLALIGAGLTAVYSVLAYPFFYVFLPQYTEAIPYSQIFAISLFLQMSVMLVSAVIDSRVTLIPKRLLYLWNIPSIVVGGSALLLIQPFGILGAIIGQLLGLLCTNLISWFLWYAIRDREHTTA